MPIIVKIKLERKSTLSKHLKNGGKKLPKNNKFKTLRQFRKFKNTLLQMMKTMKNKENQVWMMMTKRWKKTQMLKIWLVFRRKSMLTATKRLVMMM